MPRSKVKEEVKAQHAELGKFEEWFPRMVNEKGFTETGRLLGVSRGSVRTWLLELGYTTAVKVVPVGRASDDGGE